MTKVLRMKKAPRMKTVSVLIALSFAIVVSAAPTQEEETPGDETEQTGQTEVNWQETEKTPEAGNLRSRDLGDSFKNFRPSEEISADNAVSFPVDI